MSPPKQITILLVEDHTIVRQGLVALLKNEVQFKMVGEAKTGREAVKLAGALKPDIILMDIAMPQLNGLAATRQILEANPAARVLILSAHSEDVYVERMMEVGVAGFLQKQSSAQILTKAILTISKGHPFYSPSIAKRLDEIRKRSFTQEGIAKNTIAHLTSRETEVLQLVAEGSSNKQVAAVMGISIKTVEKHRQHVMEKLNIHDTAGLTRYAISIGIVECSVQVTII